MVLVPAAAAATWCAQFPSHRASLETAIVTVGDRHEVDLTRLTPLDPCAAVALERWWTATRRMWADAAADKLSSHSWVRTKRILVEDTQSTSKKDKRDLVDVFAALTDSGPLARVVIEASAADPDTTLVRAMARAAGGSFTRDASATAATLTVPMTGTLWWPNALGGPAWPGEVARDLTATFRYASWRDRRVRRLAAVTVEVTELWADPALHPPHTSHAAGSAHRP